MPLTAIGRYDIQVSKRTGCAPFYTQSFLYIPVFRIMLGCILLLGISVMVWRRALRLPVWHPVLWLVVPSCLGALVGALALSPFGGASGSTWYIEFVMFLRGFMSLAANQLICLPLVLTVTALCRRRARTACFLAGWGIQTLAVIVPYVIMPAYGTPAWLLFSLFDPLTRHVGTVLGMSAVRTRFTRTRLALGISVAWIPMAIILVGTRCAVFGFRWVHSFASYAVQQDILYVIGFWLFVAFVPWWRERVFRAYGVTPSA
jgi:hypothetical protein